MQIKKKTNNKHWLLRVEDLMPIPTKSQINKEQDLKAEAFLYMGNFREVNTSVHEKIFGKRKHVISRKTWDQVVVPINNYFFFLHDSFQLITHNLSSADDLRNTRCPSYQITNKQRTRPEAFLYRKLPSRCAPSVTSKKIHGFDFFFILNYFYIISMDWIKNYQVDVHPL